MPMEALGAGEAVGTAEAVGAMEAVGTMEEVGAMTSCGRRGEFRLHVARHGLMARAGGPRVAATGTPRAARAVSRLESPEGGCGRSDELRPGRCGRRSAQGQPGGTAHGMLVLRERRGIAAARRRTATVPAVTGRRSGRAARALRWPWGRWRPMLEMGGARASRARGPPLRLPQVDHERRRPEGETSGAPRAAGGWPSMRVAMERQEREQEEELGRGGAGATETPL